MKRLLYVFGLLSFLAILPACEVLKMGAMQLRGGKQPAPPGARPTPTSTPSATPTPTATPTTVVIPSSGTTCSGASTQSAGSTYNRLPDTTNGIYLFVDQPNGLPSDTVISFMTSHHYAGTQKMTCEQKNHFLAHSANWVQLHYRLADASGSSVYIHNNTWSSDWAQVTQHEDWFLHNPSGERLQCTVWNWEMHDVTNPEFRNYWVNSVLADMAANNSDGIFADSFSSYALLDMQSNPSIDYDERMAQTHPADPNSWPNGYTLAAQYNDFVAYLQPKLHASSPRSPLYIPNMDALNTFWWVNALNLDQLDGAFLEGAPVMDSDWVSAGNNMLRMTRAGKVVILQRGVPSDSDYDSRLFILGTYLMVKGSRTYLNMMANNSGQYAVTYWPEYALDLGAPNGGLPAAMASYANSGLYRRYFANGMVLVNPSGSSVTYTRAITDPRYLVQATGGGALDDSTVQAGGNYVGGSLSTSSSGATVVVPAWSGRILLNNPL